MEKDDAYYRDAELEIKRRELAFKERENTFGARFLKSAAVVLPLLLSLLVPYIGYMQWRTTRADNAVAAERKAALDVQRVSLYAETVFVTGKLRRLAATPEGRRNSDYTALKDAFENLYWSRLPLVEDDTVARAMVAFRKGLRYAEQPTPENLNDLALDTRMNPQNMGGTQQFLDGLTIALAHAIRDSLKEHPEPAAAAPSPAPSP